MLFKLRFELAGVLVVGHRQAGDEDVDGNALIGRTLPYPRWHAVEAHDLRGALHRDPHGYTQAEDRPRVPWR